MARVQVSSRVSFEAVMSLVIFQDKTFLGYKQTWFVWEPAWESFRPIRSVSWTGTRFQIDERGYCDDPVSELYGYASPQMKQVCETLTETYGPKVGTATPISTPEIGPMTWFFDRRVSLSPCADRDKESWKRMCRGRKRTCRRGNAEKFTRRKRIH
jgi:hypothetical protein